MSNSVSGGLFQDESDQKAFFLAANIVNTRYKDSVIRLVPESDLIENYNAYNTYLTACSLLEKGVIAIFGPSSVHSSPTIQTILDRKEIPHIETNWDRKLLRHNCLLNLHPHPSILTKAYVEIVENWNWKSLTIIYDSEESLAKLSLFISSAKYRVTLSRLELDLYDTYRTSLTTIRKSGERNFILECSFEILEMVLKQAQQVGMMTERHSYIITNLDLQIIDLAPFQYSGANITGVFITKLALIFS